MKDTDEVVFVFDLKDNVAAVAGERQSYLRIQKWPIHP